MFSFLRGVFFKRPTKRGLFGYWDGRRNVWADPLVVQDRLDHHPTYRSDIHPALAEAEDKAAWDIMISAFHDAFELEPYDTATKKGLTQLEILELHATFCYYASGLKKSTSENLTTPNSTDATSSESEKPTTKDTSDTSSTETELSSETSMSSEQPSSLPSEPNLTDQPRQ